MYERYSNALFLVAASTLDPSMTEFETTFAPVAPEPDDTWLQILLDIVSMGAAMVAAPFFNSCKHSSPVFVSFDTRSDSVYFKDLAALPYFEDSEGTVDSLKDASL